jgi:hypothetical protein
VITRVVTGDKIDMDTYCAFHTEQRDEFDAWLALHDTTFTVFEIRLTDGVVRLARVIMPLVPSALGSDREYETDLVEVPLAGPPPAWWHYQ